MESILCDVNAYVSADSCLLIIFLGLVLFIKKKINVLI